MWAAIAGVIELHLRGEPSPRVVSGSDSSYMTAENSQDRIPERIGVFFDIPTGHLMINGPVQSHSKNKSHTISLIQAKPDSRNLSLSHGISGG